MRSFIWISIALTLLLGGCVIVDNARNVIKVKGAEVADQILIDSEWAVCQAASIGSVKRRYGRTLERAGTYKAFCEGDGKGNVIAPAE